VIYTTKWKHGPIIDDLMNRIPTPEPIFKTLKMRLVDRRDVGNWVHESTHFLNRVYTSECRKATGRHCWANYTLHGNGTAFRSPAITLNQIAAFYTEPQKNRFYKSYLVEARSHYLNDPLFLVDEVVAVGNTLVYVCSNNLKDDWRAGQLPDAKTATDCLFAAAVKHDPEWPDLARFGVWAAWHNERLAHLFVHYMTDLKWSHK
jgi:hypothetical protein